MIGRLVLICEHARRDARAGRHRPVWGQGLATAIYQDAWRRERIAMAKAGRLPQLELALVPEKPLARAFTTV